MSQQQVWAAVLGYLELQIFFFFFSLPFSESENTLSLQRCQDKVLKHFWQNKKQKEKIFPADAQNLN